MEKKEIKWHKDRVMEGRRLLFYEQRRKTSCRDLEEASATEKLQVQRP
jgi:hypothetical protein